MRGTNGWTILNRSMKLPTYRYRMHRYTGKWYSLKHWFVDGQSQECEAKTVLKITSDIIRNIIQNAALIVQVQNWGISRKDDYKKFLELFLNCAG